MDKKQKTKEKICTFYASDYHFEMISMHYINKKIDEKKEIIILTENNLENTVNKLVSSINLNNEKKKKILNLNWKNDDLGKFKIINDNIKKQKQMIIFIKGKENYIKNINENIGKWMEKSKGSKIIDCYDLAEISNNIEEILNNYSKVLNSSGEKILNK